MAIKYEEIVPWGRNYEEYCRMFNLSMDDLKKRILGCGDGPANFNSICNANGGTVISVDPIYCLTKKQISDRIIQTYDDVVEQTRNNLDKFKWDSIKTLDELGKIRMKAMKDFLETYEDGKKKDKYIAESLPSLSFSNNTFDIALSSHFLFLYSDNLTYDFHKASIFEMLRVASDVRIFPLLNVNANRSPYVERIIKELDNFETKIVKVDYEFQIGGNEMLQIKRI